MNSYFSKSFLSIGLLALLALFGAACGGDDLDDAVDDAKDAAEDVADEVSDAAEKVADEVKDATN